MSDHPFRVVCAGHLNWDVTLQVDRLPEPDGEACIDGQRQAGGGSAANVAVVLAGLEASPLLLGSVGRDEHGWLARRELSAAGVETALVEVDGPTAMKYLVVDKSGELVVLGNDGANEAYAADDLPADRLKRADHLHLTSQSPETAAALARRASKSGVSVSFDPGRRLDERDYMETLQETDLLFCNEREADVLDERGLASAVSTLVVKRGSVGARAVDREAESDVSHPGYAVDPVDTTGAGDAFAAGFLVAFGEGLERALTIGNACGALAARTPGARVDIDWRDIEALLDIGPSA